MAKGLFEFCVHGKETNDKVVVDSFFNGPSGLEERSHMPMIRLKKKIMMDLQQVQEIINDGRRRRKKKVKWNEVVTVVGSGLIPHVAL